MNSPRGYNLETTRPSFMWPCSAFSTWPCSIYVYWPIRVQLDARFDLAPCLLHVGLLVRCSCSTPRCNLRFLLHERGSQPGSPILHSEVIPGKPVYNIWEISHPRAYGQIFAPLGVIYDMWYVLTWPSVCPTYVLRHSVFYFLLRGLESTYI